MREQLSCVLTLVVLGSFSLGAQAGKGNPCSDGQLKGWAKKQGYKQADCAPAPVIINTAPAITINSPSPNMQYEEGTVPAASGTAQDGEDGDLSATIRWSAETTGLAPGSHQITASVTDSGGLTSSTSVMITVIEPAPPPNSAPLLSITSPADGLQIEEGTPINLLASASDTEDGDLSGSVTWSPAASGESMVLPVGVNLLTASVADSSGVMVSQQVSVTVVEAEIEAEPPAATSTVLNWTIPTAREDGAPLSATELAGYEIYRMHEESGADQVITIDDPMTITHSVDGLVSGTHHFAISALDTNGLKSDLSPIIAITVPAGAGS